MYIESPAIAPGSAIDPRFAFAAMDPTDHVRLSQNRNPPLRWGDLPENTKSLALLCCDPDVPSVGDDVNREGATVPADLPRVDFFHWVLIDIAPEREGIDEGEASDGVVARGKEPGPCALGVQGINDYTGWFAADPEMAGAYGGYDGPGPPWNDARLHHYHFRLFALDVPSLSMTGEFSGAEVRAAMEGHVLAEAECVGTYTLNPEVAAAG